MKAAIVIVAIELEHFVVLMKRYMMIRIYYSSCIELKNCCINVYLYKYEA